MRSLFLKIYTKISKKLHLRFLLNRLLDLLPVQNNKIVFSNFNGRGYGCDPKYICEALRRHNQKLDLVWLISDPSAGKNAWDIPQDVRMVRFGSRKARYEMATAHIWVFNTKGFEKPRKKNRQFYIQTWHSCLGLKACEEKAAFSLPSAYIEAAKEDARITDLMYANNTSRFELYINHFWYNGTVIKCSVPRCSILFSNPDMVKKKVSDYFSVSSKTGIILYAPTFRGSSNTDIYKFDYIRCLNLLEAIYHMPFIFLIRLHPNLHSVASFCNFSDRIKDAALYPDIQELLAAANVLITDYSACMFDAAIAQKPVFLYTPDLEAYIKKERNLNFHPDELPFSFSLNETALFYHIENFSQEKYAKQCDKFWKQVGLIEDGTGDKYISDLILKMIER